MSGTGTQDDPVLIESSSEEANHHPAGVASGAGVAPEDINHNGSPDVDESEGGDDDAQPDGPRNQDDAGGRGGRVGSYSDDEAVDDEEDHDPEQDDFPRSQESRQSSSDSDEEDEEESVSADVDVNEMLHAGELNSDGEDENLQDEVVDVEVENGVEIAIHHGRGAGGNPNSSAGAGGAAAAGGLFSDQIAQPPPGRDEASSSRSQRVHVDQDLAGGKVVVKIEETRRRHRSGQYEIVAPSTGSGGAAAAGSVPAGSASTGGGLLFNSVQQGVLTGTGPATSSSSSIFVHPPQLHPSAVNNSIAPAASSDLDDVAAASSSAAASAGSSSESAAGAVVAALNAGTHQVHPAGTAAALTTLGASAAGASFTLTGVLPPESERDVPKSGVIEIVSAKNTPNFGPVLDTADVGKAVSRKRPLSPFAGNPLPNEERAGSRSAEQAVDSIYADLGVGDGAGPTSTSAAVAVEDAASEQHQQSVETLTNVLGSEPRFLPRELLRGSSEDESGSSAASADGMSRGPIGSPRRSPRNLFAKARRSPGKEALAPGPELPADHKSSRAPSSRPVADTNVDADGMFVIPEAPPDVVVVAGEMVVEEGEEEDAHDSPRSPLSMIRREDPRNLAQRLDGEQRIPQAEQEEPAQPTAKRLRLDIALTAEYPPPGAASSSSGAASSSSASDQEAARAHQSQQGEEDQHDHGINNKSATSLFLGGTMTLADKLPPPLVSAAKSYEGFDTEHAELLPGTIGRNPLEGSDPSASFGSDPRRGSPEPPGSQARKQSGSGADDLPPLDSRHGAGHVSGTVSASAQFLNSGASTGTSGLFASSSVAAQPLFSAGNIRSGNQHSSFFLGALGGADGAVPSGGVNSSSSSGLFGTRTIAGANAANPNTDAKTTNLRSPATQPTLFGLSGGASASTSSTGGLMQLTLGRSPDLEHEQQGGTRTSMLIAGGSSSPSTGRGAPAPPRNSMQARVMELAHPVLEEEELLQLSAEQLRERVKKMHRERQMLVDKFRRIQAADRSATAAGRSSRLSKAESGSAQKLEEQVDGRAQEQTENGLRTRIAQLESELVACRDQNRSQREAFEEKFRETVAAHDSSVAALNARVKTVSDQLRAEVQERSLLSDKLAALEKHARALKESNETARVTHASIVTELSAQNAKLRESEAELREGLRKAENEARVWKEEWEITNDELQKQVTQFSIHEGKTTESKLELDRTKVSALELRSSCQKLAFLVQQLVLVNANVDVNLQLQRAAVGAGTQAVTTGAAGAAVAPGRAVGLSSGGGEAGNRVGTTSGTAFNFESLAGMGAHLAATPDQVEGSPGAQRLQAREPHESRDLDDPMAEGASAGSDASRAQRRQGHEAEALVSDPMGIFSLSPPVEAEAGMGGRHSSLVGGTGRHAPAQLHQHTSWQVSVELQQSILNILYGPSSASMSSSTSSRTAAAANGSRPSHLNFTDDKISALSQLAEYRAELTRLKTALREKEAELDLKTADFEKQEGRFKQAQGHFGNVLKDQNDLKAKNKELVGEVDALKLQLGHERANGSKSSDMLEVLTRQLAVWKRELHRIQSQLGIGSDQWRPVSKSTLAAEAPQQSAIRQTVITASQLLETYDSEIASLQSRVISLTNEVLVAKSESRITKDRFARREEELLSVNNGLEEEKEVLEQTIGEKEEHMAGLKYQLGLAEKSFAETEEERTRLERALVTLERKVGAGDGSGRGGGGRDGPDGDGLSSGEGGAGGGDGGSSAAGEADPFAAQQLRDALKRKDAQINEFLQLESSLRIEIENLSADVRTLRSEKQRAETERLELQSESDHLLRPKIAALEEENAAGKRSNAALALEVELLGKKITSLQGDCARYAREEEERAAELKSVKEEAMREILGKEHEITSLQERAEMGKKDLEKQLSLKESQVKSRDATMSMYRKQHEDQQNLETKRKKEISELKTRISELAEEVKAEIATNERYRSHLEKLEEEKVALEKRVAAAGTAASRGSSPLPTAAVFGGAGAAGPDLLAPLQAERDALKTNLEQANSQRRLLQQSNADLLEKLKESENEIQAATTMQQMYSEKAVDLEKRLLEVTKAAREAELQAAQLGVVAGGGGGTTSISTGGGTASASVGGSTPAAATSISRGTAGGPAGGSSSALKTVLRHTDDGTAEIILAKNKQIKSLQEENKTTKKELEQTKERATKTAKQQAELAAKVKILEEQKESAEKRLSGFLLEDGGQTEGSESGAQPSVAQLPGGQRNVSAALSSREREAALEQDNIQKSLQVDSLQRQLQLKFVENEELRNAFRKKTDASNAAARLEGGDAIIPAATGSSSAMGGAGGLVAGGDHGSGSGGVLPGSSSGSAGAAVGASSSSATFDSRTGASTTAAPTVSENLRTEMRQAIETEFRQEFDLYKSETDRKVLQLQDFLDTRAKASRDVERKLQQELDRRQQEHEKEMKKCAELDAELERRKEKYRKLQDDLVLLNNSNASSRKESNAELQLKLEQNRLDFEERMRVEMERLKAEFEAERTKLRKEVETAKLAAIDEAAEVGLSREKMAVEDVEMGEAADEMEQAAKGAGRGDGAEGGDESARPQEASAEVVAEELLAGGVDADADVEDEVLEPEVLAPANADQVDDNDAPEDEDQDPERDAPVEAVAADDAAMLEGLADEEVEAQVQEQREDAAEDVAANSGEDEAGEAADAQELELQDETKADEGAPSAAADGDDEELPALSAGPASPIDDEAVDPEAEQEAAAADGVVEGELSPPAVAEDAAMEFVDEEQQVGGQQVVPAPVSTSAAVDAAPPPPVDATATAVVAASSSASVEVRQTVNVSRHEETHHLGVPGQPHVGVAPPSSAPPGSPGVAPLSPRSQLIQQETITTTTVKTVIERTIVEQNFEGIGDLAQDAVPLVDATTSSSVVPAAAGGVAAIENTGPTSGAGVTIEEVVEEEDPNDAEDAPAEAGEGSDEAQQEIAGVAEDADAMAVDHVEGDDVEELQAEPDVVPGLEEAEQQVAADAGDDGLTDGPPGDVVGKEDADQDVDAEEAVAAQGLEDPPASSATASSAAVGHKRAATEDHDGTEQAQQRDHDPPEKGSEPKRPKKGED